MMLVIRLAVAVATLGLLSPAAGQAPKLSTQQLNQPTLNVNKPIAAPKVYSPNLNKPITAAPITVQRPVPDDKPRPMAHGSIASGTIKLTEPSGHTYYHTAPGRSPYANANNKTSKLPPAADPDPSLAGYGGILQSHPTSSDTSSSGATSSGYPPCPGGKSPDPYGNC
jgi:hypothetical protein